MTRPRLASLGIAAALSLFGGGAAPGAASLQLGAGAVKFSTAQPFFDELLADNEDQFDIFGGYAIMTFSGAKAGSISFQATASNSDDVAFPFSDYMQKVDANGVLEITFTKKMPHCDTLIGGQFQQ